MSGSGSTIVAVGSSEAPAWLYEEEQYKDLFISPARFLTRREGEWFEPLGTGAGAAGAAK